MSCGIIGQADEDNPSSARYIPDTNLKISRNTYIKEKLFKDMNLGIQSSPVFSPPGTRGADTGVPWDDGTCAVGSQFLRLEGGKVSRSDSYSVKGFVNGHTMFERILRNPGKRCTKTHSEFIVGSLKAKADVQLSFARPWRDVRLQISVLESRSILVQRLRQRKSCTRGRMSRAVGSNCQCVSAPHETKTLYLPPTG